MSKDSNKIETCQAGINPSIHTEEEEWGEEEEEESEVQMAHEQLEPQPQAGCDASVHMRVRGVEFRAGAELMHSDSCSVAGVLVVSTHLTLAWAHAL